MEVVEALVLLDGLNQRQKLSALISGVQDIARRVEDLNWWEKKGDCLTALDRVAVCLNPQTSQAVLNEHFWQHKWLLGSPFRELIQSAFLDPSLSQLASNLIGLGAVACILDNNGSCPDVRAHLQVGGVLLLAALCHLADGAEPFAFQVERGVRE